VLRQRTEDYRHWVEAYARNQHIPIEMGGEGTRKEDYVLPPLHRMERRNAFGVYFIFRSMEQGRTFRIPIRTFTDHTGRQRKAHAVADVRTLEGDLGLKPRR
jgi:hypothetical protein